MIDSEVFRASRSLAREKLAPEEAANSFGYWIDIPNDWESYQSPEELVKFLGIHLTHHDKFNEIIEDIGPLSRRELRWVHRYVELIDRIARMLSTTGFRVDLKNDIAETIVDWRVIERFSRQPCRILDYGAGCGRQAASAFLRNPDNIYVAVDSTLAAYTLQNLVMSYTDTLCDRANFFDLLDFEKASRAFVDISNACQGDRFHVPAWMAIDHLPKDFFDVIIAAHVHCELSSADFMRLVNVVEKSLSRNGVFYVRSELTWGDTRDFCDSTDLHGISLVDEMLNRRIHPVWCAYTSGFLTTVFARKDSRYWHETRESADPDCRFLDITSSQELSRRAGQNHLHRCARELEAANPPTLMIRSGNEYDQMFVDPLIERKQLSCLKTMKDVDLLGGGAAAALKQIAAFNPQAVVIASQQYPAIEAIIARELPGLNLPIRRYYWYPVVFLYSSSIKGADKIFDSEIMSIEDVRISATQDAREALSERG